MKQTSPNNPDDTEKLLREIAADSEKSARAAGGCITDAVSGWLAAQYAATTHAELAAADAPRRWEVLRACVQDWTRLRRSDRAVDRLQLARETLAWRRSTTQAEKEKEFREWVTRPDIRKELFPDEEPGLSPETIQKIERELNLL